MFKKVDQHHSRPNPEKLYIGNPSNGDLYETDVENPHHFSMLQKIIKLKSGEHGLNAKEISQNLMQLGIPHQMAVKADKLDIVNDSNTMAGYGNISKLPSLHHFVEAVTYNKRHPHKPGNLERVHDSDIKTANALSFKLIDYQRLDRNEKAAVHQDYSWVINPENKEHIKLAETYLHAKQHETTEHFKNQLLHEFKSAGMPLTSANDLRYLNLSYDDGGDGGSGLSRKEELPKVLHFIKKKAKGFTGYLDQDFKVHKDPFGG